MCTYFQNVGLNKILAADTVVVCQPHFANLLRISLPWKLTVQTGLAEIDKSAHDDRISVVLAKRCFGV